MRPTVVALSLYLFATAALAAERHVLLQPAAPLTAADREELAAKGIVIQRAAANGRYIARVSDDASADARVVALQAMTEEIKIHPAAFREAARGRVFAQFSVYFHDDVAFDDAYRTILAAGGALAEPLTVDFAPMRLLRAKVPPQSLRTLAADDRVLMVSGPRHLRLQPHNATSAAVSHVTELQAAPYGLTGKGVAVSLFELAEAQGSHVEFGGRMTVFATGGASSEKQHATHVAGTIGAAGVNAAAKGMAPAAKLYQYKVDVGPNLEPLYHTPKQTDLVSRGVVVDNNSWGFVIAWSDGSPYWVWEDNAELFGSYDFEYTAPLDQISNQTNVLFVHSSGNEGDGVNLGAWGEHRHLGPLGQPDTTRLYCYSKNGSGTDCPLPCTAGASFCETAQHHTIIPFDTLNVTAAAKNVLTVGAVDTSRNIMGLSSRGPAKDGRVKPEVVARGSSVFSTIPTNNYSTSNGTSMAAPVVTGVAALLTEQWRRTFAATPKASQLKAVIIAGTTDLGNAGPDYTHGFGLVDAKASADLIIADAGQGKHIRTSSVAHGAQYEVPVIVDSTKNLRIVLNWADPPVFLPANQTFTASALVNDLDVKVIDPSGTTRLPFVLDKANVNAAATRGVNTIDNVEELLIANAAPGTYRVVVSGRSVPQGPQEFVLVTTARTPRPCRDLQEPNDVANDAHGNLVPGQTVTAGFCAAGDVDYFKYPITKSGPISIDIDNTGDTPLRVTSFVIGGETKTIEVPARTFVTLTTSYEPGPLPVAPEGLLQFEPLGPIGVEADYTFTPRFGQVTGPRRRAVRN